MSFSVYLTSAQIQSKYHINIPVNVEVRKGVAINKDKIAHLVSIGRKYYDAQAQLLKASEAFYVRHGMDICDAKEFEKGTQEYIRVEKLTKLSKETFQVMKNLKAEGYALRTNL